MRLTAPIAGLALILLLLEARETLGDNHSLCFNFTVRPQISSTQPWFEGNGSMDGKPFFTYDSESDKVKPLGLLGEMVKATKEWEEMAQTLEKLGEGLRKVLLAKLLEKNLSSDHPNLQVMLCCQQENGQGLGAWLKFSINRHTALIDMMTLKWIVIDPGAAGIKEEWENSQSLPEYFTKISTQICFHWINEFLEQWETMLNSTVTIIIPDNYQASSSAPLTAWVILPVVIFIFVPIIMSARRCCVRPALQGIAAELSQSQ